MNVNAVFMVVLAWFALEGRGAVFGIFADGDR